MKSIYKWGAVAFGVSLVSTIVYGQARTPYTRPAYITTPGTVTAGSVVSNGNITIPSASSLCMDGPTCANRLNQNANQTDYWANNTAVWSATPNFMYVYKTAQFNSVLNYYGASGTNAFNCTNVGCRLSLGNTGRYLVDDGTNLEFIAPVQATTFEATTASGSSLTGGGASGSLLITSNTPDSFTSATVGAVTIQPSQALTSNDSVLIVKNSAGTDLLRVRSRSDGVGVVVAGAGDADFSGRGVINFSNTLELSSWLTPSTNSVGAKIGAYSAFTSDTAKPVQIINGTAFSTEVAHFSKDGLLRVNSANAAKPTCNANNRGRVFYLDGAAGVADTYEICMKNAADAYAWKTIVTP